MLMNMAHRPGNVAALRKVKCLRIEAQETEKKERTDVQTHLLEMWRSVEWDDGSPPKPKRKGPPNPTASAEEWKVYYATLPTTSPQLPRELRRDPEGKPLLSDVIALRTVARLKPGKSDDNGIQFKPAVAQFFSVQGAYEDSLRNQNLTIAPSVTYTPYTGSNTDDIARHFASCGITYAVANTHLGPWAREYLQSHPDTSEGHA